MYSGLYYNCGFGYTSYRHYELVINRCGTSRVNEEPFLGITIANIYFSFIVVLGLVEGSVKTVNTEVAMLPGFVPFEGSCRSGPGNSL